MKIIIIGQNEGEYITPMCKSLQGFDKTWVLDRCTDSSENILRELGEKNIIINSLGEGRLTSYCRNLGYSCIGENDDVLFLDGDRYVVSGDLKELENTTKDLVLLKLEEDPRDNMICPFEETWGTVYNNFYSCGLFIRKSAQDKIKQFYTTRRKDYGNSIIFPESIQELWGIEDTHLGDICYHLGLSCEINDSIRLRGRFTKTQVDSLDTIEQRFILRDKLKAIWQ